MRRAPYGKRFFRLEFNRTSQDVYLPDCSGFGLAHCWIAVRRRLSTFSTQKCPGAHPCRSHFLSD
jgi:alpha-mannosidase